MKIVAFEIKNFKGIEKTTINLADEIPGTVVTLIGLNESGKTTILEAISNFITEDQETASLVGTVHRKSSIQDFIPKDKKAAFTGAVSVKAKLKIDQEDKIKIEKFYDELGYILDVNALPEIINVTRQYEFQDSIKKSILTTWNVDFSLRSKRAKSETFVSYSSHKEKTKMEWLQGVSFLRRLIPKIVYFPTFLFNFPDRIYLEDGQGEGPNDYYRQVIQDVLNSQGEGLSVERHIIDRIKAVRDGYDNPVNFLSYFWGVAEKGLVDAVTQKISNQMSKVIFGAWSNILERDVQNKRVQVDWHLDGNKGNTPYLQLSIVDGQSKYELSERSLGFRWFFSFLLFTQFRKSREAAIGTVFIFDEPASNLHSRAQIKLLDSFAKISGGNTYVIYSTHSHYMVNPLWLEKAYIVENKAIDYEEGDQVDAYSPKKTEVNAIKYRNFVGKNPSKTTYFQPVLDALNVTFSPLVSAKYALIVEGKFDFHPFTYFWKHLSTSSIPKIFPANGAGDVGALINLFRGWGVNFKILFDDDRAGREGQKNCKTNYLVPDDSVLTLGDIDEALKGKVFEDIYQDDVRDAAATHFFVKPEELRKRQFSLFFQEMLAREARVDFPQTQASFEKILNWVHIAFQDETESSTNRIET